MSAREWNRRYLIYLSLEFAGCFLLVQFLYMTVVYNVALEGLVPGLMCSVLGHLGMRLHLRNCPQPGGIPPRPPKGLLHTQEPFWFGATCGKVW